MPSERRGRVHSPARRPRPDALLSRRAFVVASAGGLARLPAVTASPTRPASARSTILFVLAGGASHVDTWDMKPDAPAEIRGPFRPVATATPGIRLCEHLPLLAKQTHRLALVHGIDGQDPTNSHLAYYSHLTGHPL